MSARRRSAVVLGFALAAAACGDERTPQEKRGAALIAENGCGACHVVPGVRGARGLAGPPLTEFGRRVLVGGHLPNTQENLAGFIMDPQRVEPGTAMPDLDVGPADAAAMAAYLRSLR